MKTQLIDANAGVSTAVALLAAGETVALPTETVYGLGADALNPLACAKIFEAKERPLSDPLIVHIPDRGWLERLAEVSPLALHLARHFWPGPFTMVLPRKETVHDLITGGQDTVALRMSAHPVFQAVLKAFGKPIAAPSANRFGRISPTCAEHVLEELGGKIPLVVNGGPCAHGIESTIVLVKNKELQILRRGPILAEQLAGFGIVQNSHSNINTPGNLKSHYAPRTPLVISKDNPPSSMQAGLLAWSRRSREGFAQVEWLSKNQDMREAAINLYGAMRRLDAAGLDIIIAEPLPEIGLGAAIMERLRKAAA